VALAIPSGPVETVDGVVAGMITDQPRGSNGFGYDPIFYLPAYNATMAELPTATKNQISHRAQAAAKAKARLRQFIAD
jgi:XTP/dITP diphosphohydrolase